MVASIGALTSAAQGVSYYERDGYYAKDDAEHRAASAWLGTGAAEAGLEGTVDPEAFRAVLEGVVPDGSGRQLGRIGKEGERQHRPGRDLTLSAPKSVSLAALVGGDARVVDAHDRAVARTVAWFEKNVAETRMKDPETGRVARTGGQKTVVAAFRHDTSRNLDPALHTHAVIANMVKDADGKWRSMSNERLYESKMLLGALYRNELAAGLSRLGYGIDKTHADGRFEIAGVSRDVVEAFSTRRAEIQAAMAERNLGSPADNPRLAERAALMTRSAKRDIDRDELTGIWQKQAADLGFDARELVAEAERGVAVAKAAGPSMQGPEQGAAREASSVSGPESAVADGPGADRDADRSPASEAVAWAVAHLSEREAVFARTDLLAAALAWSPGAARVEDIEREVAAREAAGTLHAARLPGLEDRLTTDRAVADERETIALMRTGQGRGAEPMRGRAVDKALRNGPLTHGQKEAVRLILSAEDRVVGVQGYAGSGKTTMLNRARTLLEKKGYEVRGLAPSASAARTLEGEAGIGSETLQRFLMRYSGVAEGRMTKKGAKEMRAAFAKTALVVDEGSLASTVQARNLLRIADALRIPRVVLVGDEKQLDAVDAGKPFAQLQREGMKTATMDEIMRQRDPALKAAVEASLAGDVRKAFEKLGSNIDEVKPDNLAGAAAARWLALSPEERAVAGGTRQYRAHGSEPCAARGHQRDRARAPDARRRGPRSRHAIRTAGLEGLHQCREIAGGQLRCRRCGGVPPSLQASRGREGRRAARRGRRSRGRRGQARRQGRAIGAVETGEDRRAQRRGRGLQKGRYGAARRRPHPLDAQRHRSRAGEQPDRRGCRGAKRHRDVPSRGRTHARSSTGRCAATPCRPRLGLDRACVPGAHGGYRDRRDGGEPPQSHHAEDALRRDQPGAGQGRAGDRRQGGAQGAARSRDR